MIAATKLDPRIELAPGSLLPALVARSSHALACGAMQPIETVEETVRDAGIDFIVRRVSSLERKDEDRQRTAGEASAQANPFLPHDPDLYVADVSNTHFLLLNKFKVIDNHLLLVTRRFARQEALLDGADFEALAACMAQLDGLGFYNGGEIAGASQRHKHLQLVPLPLSAAGPPVPVEPLFESVHAQAGMVRVPGLPFRHVLARVEPAWFDDFAVAETRLHALYLELLAGAGLGAVGAQAEALQSGPYNLLVTRRWMLLVPRSKEGFEGISVNALGFAGSLFVRSRAQLDALKRSGPMEALRAVSLPD